VEGRVWITYHEGFSNAVRKPLTLAEIMREL
jgi:chromosome transmission fidelity protein 18